MTVFVADEQSASPQSPELWEGRLEQLLGELGVPASVEVSLTFVDDPAIARLNRDFRGKDRPTDVLSFPQVDYPGYAAAVESLQRDAGADAPPVALGDIVVSVPTALRQAEEYDHPPERELGFLIVHGLLHLLGEDHETPEEEERMRELQRRLLAIWGLERRIL